MRALLVVATLVALVVSAAPAAAAESCGRKVIDDWFDDGRVDGTYALRCYEDAIDILPADVKVYSSATEDIRRALQNRKRGKPAPPARTDPTPEDPDTPVTNGDPGDPNTETTGTPPGNGPGDGDGENEVAGPVDTESASSVPIPLLILAGLALLLVAGGSAGYIIRRVQARRAPPSAA